MRYLLPLIFLSTALAAADYPLGPDSQRQPGVPQGKVTQYAWNNSKIFPGTHRDYWVYVPAQYDGAKPACVMVFQDGGGYIQETGAWRVPVVFDNLIAKKEMPVTIGIFVNPGVLPALATTQQNRYNRSYEYDALGDRYARFLIEEVLPEVGSRYKLSTNPDDRAIAGASSGGSAAFTAAWNRPDAFHRVMSFIGSFVNLRGAEAYSSLVRKSEAKPLRVFLQDGDHDLNIYSGSWWMANQDLAKSLEFAGYETRFVTGVEGHNGKQGASVLPDALRWLWQDYPKSIAKPQAENAERRFISTILDSSKEWELVGDGYQFTEGPAIDRNGTVYFVDIPSSRILRVNPEGGVEVFKENVGKISGLMFGADGRLYAAQGGNKQIVAYGADGKENVLARDVASNDLAVSSKGDVYFTDPPGHRLWRIDSSGNKSVVHEGLQFPNGVRFSPDESLLLVADSNTRWVWSFQVQPDGSLTNGEPFYRMELLETSDAGLVRSGADGLALDTEGYLYVATRAGVQICDQPGRVVAVIPPPDAKTISNLVFAGPDMQTLYVTAVDKVWRRHLRRKGFYPWQPLKPPVPGL